jgi:hypothetical protein
MKTYVLSFDLNHGYDQSEIFEELANLGETQQALSSTWFLKSELTAKEIRDKLGAHLAADERVMVMKSGGPAAWRNVMCDNKWLIENLSNKQ